jgi:hypothetical protein
VRTFRHAVALDERRAKFKANLWNRPSAEEARLGSNSTSAATAEPSLSSPATVGGLDPPAAHQSASSFDDPDSLYDAKENGANGSKKGPSAKNILFDNAKNDKVSKNHNSNGHRSLKGRKEDEGDRVLTTLERMYSEKSEQTTDIEEVWFAVRALFFYFRTAADYLLFCF